MTTNYRNRLVNHLSYIILCLLYLNGLSQTLTSSQKNNSIVYPGTFQEEFFFEDDVMDFTWQQLKPGLKHTPSFPGGEIVSNFGQQFNKGRSNPWSQITGIPGAYVVDIVISPINPNIVYASTYGSGVYKSTDAGKTWTQTALTNVICRTNGLAVHPKDSNILYIGAADAGHFEYGTYKSLDGGTTFDSWGPLEITYAADIKVHPVRPDTIFIDSPEGVYYTFDGGTTWNLHDNVSSLNDMAFHPQNPDYILLVRSSRLYQSIDGGMIFSEIELSEYYSTLYCIKIDPFNPQNIYIGARYGFLKSNDSGLNWILVNTHFGYNPENPESPQPEIASISIDWVNSNHLFCTSNDYGIFESFNGGLTWFSQHPQLPGLPMENQAKKIIYSSGDQQFIAALWWQGIWRFDGNNWTSNNDGLGNQFIEKIVIQDENSIWAATLGNGVFRSLDGGSSWHPMNTGLDTWYIYSLVMNPMNPQKLLLGTRFKGVYLTNDGGNNWQYKIGDSIFIRHIKYSASNPSVVYATGEHQYLPNQYFYKSENGGDNWSAVYSGSETLYGYGINPLNENHLILCARYTPPGMNRGYYTIESFDGGLSWNWSNPVPINGDARDIIFTPDASVVLAGTWGEGLYILTENGWESYGNGLPENTYIGEFEYMDNGDILLTTWGAGIYRSQDQGLNWLDDNEGLNNSGALCVTSNLIGENIIEFIATYNGIFKRMRSAVGLEKYNKTHLKMFTLHQNYPNPFNPSTKINYQLSKTNDVELSIYNLLGHKVAVLVSEKQRAGRYQIEWDASNMPSGLYFYRIKAGNFIGLKKMILMR